VYDADPEDGEGDHANGSAAAARGDEAHQRCLRHRPVPLRREASGDTMTEGRRGAPALCC